MIGTCKLCDKNGIELKKSHLLPANIYKKIRRAPGANNSLVEASKDSFRFTDKQISDYVLCDDCEKRFAEVESWVSRQCLQSDGCFPLRDIAMAHPLFSDPEFNMISGKAAGIDVYRYVYFASSILWRTGVHVWTQGVTIELGSYKEQLRLYLYGQTAFPTDGVMVMFIATKADTQDQFTTTPVPLVTSGYLHYEFAIPGIQFQILLGKQIPSEFRGACLLRSTESIVFVGDHLNQRPLKAALKTARVTERVQKGAAAHRKRLEQS